MAQIDLHAQGKVRDIYEAGEHLMMVASDRISAFDVVLPSPIPGKGQVLSGMTLHWLSLTGDIIGNHLLSADVDEYPEPFRSRRAELAGRAMLVKRAEMVPIECVARGYITGSGWKEYRQMGSVCGIRLPDGLLESQELPEPIFTPATKATIGHDENISLEQTSELVGRGLAEKLKEATLSLYEFAAVHARQRGIIVADTKFEFGFAGGELILCDEVLTPDSSRFWPADGFEPGRGQASFDKQYVRDWLDRSGWDHEPPAPVLPEEVVGQTVARYREAYERLTGELFDGYLERMGAAR